jgi:hypothetical protein
MVMARVAHVVLVRNRKRGGMKTPHRPNERAANSAADQTQCGR